MECTWFVIRTHSRREKYAAENIARQKFLYYLPLVAETEVKHGRKVERVRPLFPCYLFVRNVNGRWRVLRSTFGVQSIMPCGDAPATVSNAVIEQMREREEHGRIVLPKKPEFEPGDAVHVWEGVFAGCDGLYEGMEGLARVSVLLDLFGRRTRVAIDRRHVEARR